MKLPLELSDAWAWALSGLALAGAEALLPGIFLIWFGLAAFAMALILAAFDLTWPVQLLGFSLLALAAAGLGRQLTRHGPSELGQRGHDLVGQSFTLDIPILNGTSRLRQGDTSWRVTGPDLPSGSRVRVIRLDGATLVVEAADQRVDARDIQAKRG